MIELPGGVVRWVDTTQETKENILEYARMLRPRSWRAISKRILLRFKVSVSDDTIRVRLTPGAMKEHRQRCRMWRLKNPQRSREQMNRCRKNQGKRLYKRKLMREGKIPWAFFRGRH